VTQQVHLDERAPDIAQNVDPSVLAPVVVEGRREAVDQGDRGEVGSDADTLSVGLRSGLGVESADPVRGT
jgi:hypothetical protein